jgi:hypothetical protein
MPCRLAAEEGKKERKDAIAVKPSLRDLYGGRFSISSPSSGKAATFKESRGLRSARAESRACASRPNALFQNNQV